MSNLEISSSTQQQNLFPILIYIMTEKDKKPTPSYLDFMIKFNVIGVAMGIIIGSNLKDIDGFLPINSESNFELISGSDAIAR